MPSGDPESPGATAPRSSEAVACVARSTVAVVGVAFEELSEPGVVVAEGASEVVAALSVSRVETASEAC